MSFSDVSFRDLSSSNYLMSPEYTGVLSHPFKWIAVIWNRFIHVFTQWSIVTDNRLANRIIEHIRTPTALSDQTMLNIAEKLLIRLSTNDKLKIATDLLKDRLPKFDAIINNEDRRGLFEENIPPPPPPPPPSLQNQSQQTQLPPSTPPPKSQQLPPPPPQTGDQSKRTENRGGGNSSTQTGNGNSSGLNIAEIQKQAQKLNNNTSDETIEQRIKKNKRPPINKLNEMIKKTKVTLEEDEVFDNSWGTASTSSSSRQNPLSQSVMKRTEASDSITQLKLEQDGLKKIIADKEKILLKMKGDKEKKELQTKIELMNDYLKLIGSTEDGDLILFIKADGELRAQATRDDNTAKQQDPKVIYDNLEIILDTGELLIDSFNSLIQKKASIYPNNTAPREFNVIEARLGTVQNNFNYWFELSDLIMKNEGKIVKETKQSTEESNPQTNKVEDKAVTDLRATNMKANQSTVELNRQINENKKAFAEMVKGDVKAKRNIFGDDDDVVE